MKIDHHWTVNHNGEVRIPNPSSPLVEWVRASWLGRRDNKVELLIIRRRDESPS